MNKLQWSAKFNVGLEAIDDQHRILIGMINKFSDALGSPGQYSIRKETLEHLVAFSRNLFDYEETEMRQYGFPAEQVHISEHEAIIQKAMSLSGCIHPTGHRSARKILQSLEFNLIEHFLTKDFQYAEFFRNRNIVVRPDFRGVEQYSLPIVHDSSLTN